MFFTCDYSTHGGKRGDWTPNYLRIYIVRCIVKVVLSVFPLGEGGFWFRDLLRSAAFNR